MDFNWKTITAIIVGLYILYRITSGFSKIENEYDKEIETIIKDDKYKVKDQWS